MPMGYDSSSYILAATALREGLNPYDAVVWGHLAGGVQYPASEYLYPPLLAVLAIPVSYLPMMFATRLFALLVLIGFLVFALLLGRWLDLRLAMGMVFLFPLTWENIYFGQINFLIAILLLLAIQAVEAGRPITLGVSLFLGALLKITPVVSILVLLRRGYWAALLAGLVSAAVVIMLTLPKAGLHLWIQGSYAALTAGPHIWWLGSWTGQLTYWLRTPYGEILSLVLGSTALAVTLYRSNRIPSNLALSATILLPLLFARITWSHHAVMALPVLGVLWRRSPGNRLLAVVSWWLSPCCITPAWPRF